VISRVVDEGLDPGRVLAVDHETQIQCLASSSRIVFSYVP
jgi:hypothetical protein